MRKGVADLHRRAQVSQAGNDRYGQALASTKLQPTVEQTMESICKPVTRAGKRHRAVRPLHESDMKLLKAVNDGRWIINGFRNADIREVLMGSDPDDAAERARRSGRITRQLGLLHAHGLIKKVSNTRRWLMTEKGRTIAALLIATANTEPKTLLPAA